MMTMAHLQRRGWRGAVLGIALAATWLLKRYYTRSSVDGLVFILAPTAKLVTLLTGVRFELESGVGYLSHDRLFAIAPACAGINFMIAVIALLAFLLSRCVRDFRSSLVATATSLGLAYVATVIVNGVRIALALTLAAHPVASDFWTEARVHRTLGIGVYFGALALMQIATSRVIAGRGCS